MFYVWISLWILSFAGAAVTPWSADPAATCERALIDKIDGRAKNLNFDPIYFDSKKGGRIPVFSSINRANIGFIFRHQYDVNHPERFGAKAIAAKTLLGFRVIWFFPTGEGLEGHNVHHRDALSAMIQYYGKMGYDWITSVNQTTAVSNERHPHRFPEVSDDLSILDKYLIIQEGLDDMGQAFDEGGAQIKIRGANSDLAEHPLLAHWISEAQGFQLTAEKIDGEFVVTQVSIDSAITNFQIHNDLPLDAAMQTELFEKTLGSIGKKVSRFKRPAWPSGLNLVELPLQVDEDSDLEP